LIIRRQHTLGLQEARRRVERVADEFCGKLGLHAEWEEEHLRVAGPGVTGRILVFEESVEVHVRVGMAMMLLREPIRAAIERSIDDYIS